MFPLVNHYQRSSRQLSLRIELTWKKLSKPKIAHQTKLCLFISEHKIRPSELASLKRNNNGRAKSEI